MGAPIYELSILIAIDIFTIIIYSIVSLHSNNIPHQVFATILGHLFKIICFKTCLVFLLSPLQNCAAPLKKQIQ